MFQDVNTVFLVTYLELKKKKARRIMIELYLIKVQKYMCIAVKIENK